MRKKRNSCPHYNANISIEFDFVFDFAFDFVFVFVFDFAFEFVFEFTPTTIEKPPTITSERPSQKPNLYSVTN
jgi:hypothetical protein